MDELSLIYKINSYLCLIYEDKFRVYKVLQNS